MENLSAILAESVLQTQENGMDSLSRQNKEWLDRSLRSHKHWRLKRIGLSPRQEKLTLESFRIDKENKKATEAAQALIKGNLSGLFCFGDVGRGKTHLAIAIAQEVAKNITPKQVETNSEWVYYRHTPWLIQELRERVGRNEALSEFISDLLQECCLLVLDDLGADRVTDFVVDQIYLLIDAIYQREIPLVVTSNLTFAQIAERLDPRIASRLAGMCKGVELGGPDRRTSRRR